MMTKTEKILLTGVLILFTTNIGTAVFSFSMLEKFTVEIKRAKEEEVLARIANNRMLRSRTNFRLPGFTSINLERVTRNADTNGTPWFVPAGVAKHENGGDTLEVGMQNVPLEIRLRNPVMEWQYIALNRMLNQQAWRVILSDPELLPKVLIPFAQIYKSDDPQRWLDETTSLIVDYRNIEDGVTKRNEAKVDAPPPSKAKGPSKKNFRKKFSGSTPLKLKTKEKRK